MAELRIPNGLRDLPLQITYNQEGDWQQAWRQIGWWHTSSPHEVHDMTTDRTDQPGWMPVWIQVDEVRTANLIT